MPQPTHLSITVSVNGSGLITNLTPRKSLICLRVSIPYGESFPTRTFETSCGHNAQRRNNKPYKAIITVSTIRGGKLQQEKIGTHL